MKIDRVRDKDGDIKLIITDSMPRGERRQLANIFIDDILTLTPAELDGLTEEELEQKLLDFKQRHPLREDNYHGYLDLHLVKAEAYSRVIEERAEIIQAGNEIPDEGVRTEPLLDLLFEIVPDQTTF